MRVVSQSDASTVRYDLGPTGVGGNAHVQCPLGEEAIS